MKVSNKIISGFVVVMLLAIGVLANQLRVIYRMQKVNQDISDIDMTAATIALDTKKLAGAIDDNSSKYFVFRDPLYENKVLQARSDFLDDIKQLKKAARSDRELDVVTKLSEALDGYWDVFNQLKEQNRTWNVDELPPDLTISLDHLETQSDFVFEAVKGAMKDQVAAAADTGKKAERISWIVGVFSVLLGVFVFGLIVRSITDPLRRLTQGTRAISKGQFWHRIPAHGKDEFAELARDFNAMTERLGELDKMKREFVSHVSHDLKAPLASIRQIMHLLLEQIPGPLNQQQHDLIRLSYNSAERLAAMVGNLLDVSRMEAGSMEYQMSANDVIALIKSVTDEFDIQARDKGIQLQLECVESAVFAECDRDRIIQVVGNLYENALKFSPRDANIVTRVRRVKSEIVISVSDSGPGVPDGHKERIFHKFHQVKHGKKVAGQGVGLGLAICKTIVEAHHGQIWVEDNPNGGSIFSFALRPAASEEILKCGQSA
jgi:two-component system sensor histidine kinase GlrK